MRLTTIKLAGFKSFVDPTTLHLPTNMSGIVGPNGCGKSNIIDAVRWVLGESAASRLRGDSLTDVIFSGSNARKPVGQATVELLFDNADGTISGEYANYAEISVKRSVSRDGQSQYYLNGVRCRRRDITDLFLGTGLGPRSYSMIEQGMISDIVESHPEHLRTHLEEAAGISKYKERRKETESRIRSTRENIERISDINDEVEKQLDRLNRQARAAERWKRFKDQQSRLEAELHALNYRAIQRDLHEHGGSLRQAELAAEKQQAEYRHVEAQLETRRDHQQQAHEALNAVQGDAYKVGAEIARIEQQIRHRKELAERLRQNRQEADQAWDELEREIESDRARMESLREAVEQGDPALQESKASLTRTGERQQQAESALVDWQQRWEAHTGDSAEAAQAAEVERTRLNYLENQVLDVGKRRETLENERQGIDLESLEASLAQLLGKHKEHQDSIQKLEAQMEQRKQAHERVLAEERQVQDTLSVSRRKLEAAHGRLSSLQALQHAALGQESDAIANWLEVNGLHQVRRLGEALEVDDDWEHAVETVLGGVLEGVLVDDPVSLSEPLDSLDDADMLLLSGARDERDQANTSASLAAHARGPEVALAWLAQVRTAENAGAARAIAAELPPGQSVITPQGLWLSARSARVLRAGGRQAGVLEREREIQALGEQITALEAEVRDLDQDQSRLKQARGEAEATREDAQRELYAAHRRLSELAGEVQGHRGKQESSRTRIGKIAEELEQLSARHEDLQSQTREARSRLESAVARMSEIENRRGELEAERRQRLEAREEARLEAREAADQAHRQALELESRRSALTSLQQALERMQSQREQLQSRRQQLQEQLDSGDEPDDALERERQSYLDQRLLVDRKLVQARKQVEEHDAELRRLEQERQRLEHALEEAREGLSEKRLGEQALRMRGQQIAEAIERIGHSPADLVEELAEEADAEQWQQRLESLNAKIQRLEPVNLAAIGEHEEQVQRKQYLDAQMTDLRDALETLENAIRKIDRETRQRFKETFDKVNAGMQELFPRLFGGGHAYLELTGEDLLSTGVVIMARPPGKRISSISLLSGGEKALTAVALVFAIFRLNPAPFCLLDEVDAPLDEANVGRFSNLVTEMSEQVQFIFVTHNKGTMEAAHQLCGVTMREAGVSRLVQVDIAEAAKLAGAA